MLDPLLNRKSQRRDSVFCKKDERDNDSIRENKVYEKMKKHVNIVVLQSKRDVYPLWKEKVRLENTLYEKKKNPGNNDVSQTPMKSYVKKGVTLGNAAVLQMQREVYK